MIGNILNKKILNELSLNLWKQETKQQMNQEEKRKELMMWAERKRDNVKTM